MTTIAYKAGIIAYDGRVTSGDTIVDDNREKMVERDGVRFFFCGAGSDFSVFIDTYLGDRVTPRSIDCAALVVKDGQVSCVGVDTENFMWECQIPAECCYSLGSGSGHALTAMDMGATACQAVGMAARRDTCTGGTIRTYEIAR